MLYQNIDLFIRNRAVKQCLAVVDDAFFLIFPGDAIMKRIRLPDISINGYKTLHDM